MKAIAKKNIQVLLVDDEALARRGLKHRLQALPGIEVKGEARNGREAIRMIRERRPQLVFLDIQMPGLSGFDVLRQLRDEPLPAIVFVTAYDEFAISAFEVNAVDYLLKPVEEQRLAEAVDRARQRIGDRQLKAQQRTLLKLLGDVTGESVQSMDDLRNRNMEELKPRELARLAIKDGGKTTWVRQEDIEWVDAAGDYMCVHALGETHIMRRTMKDLEAELDAEFLQRIHRSTIVNIRQVTEMQAHINGEYFLKLHSGHTVKLSRSYKSKLKHLLPH